MKAAYGSKKSDKRTIVNVRLTRTQVVDEDGMLRFSLRTGAIIGFSLNRNHVDFNHPETSLEVLEAHKEFSLSQKELDQKMRSERREKTNARYRKSAFDHEVSRQGQALLGKVHAWCDAPGERAAAIELDVRAQSRKLQDLKTRGPVPPDCGHAGCQSDIDCEKNMRSDTDSLTR